MGGIQATTGPFSGIDTQSLINQLLQLAARPRDLAQRRLVQLQAQETAYLDLNSRLSQLQTAARAFQTQNIFGSASATSTSETTLTATASAGATLGSYSFLVDRLVSTQQNISRGFLDRNSTAAGLTALTFETARGRLDTNVELASLNGGGGVARGRIVVTDASNASATVDLSRVATVQDVVDAINNTTGVHVHASLQGDHFVLTDTSGGAGTLTVASATGDTTATSLGLDVAAASGVITGRGVYRLGATTTLQTLNDGNGVRLNTAVGTSTPDLTITTRDGVAHSVDLGNLYDAQSHLTSAAVSNLQGVIDRINSQTSGAVTASINAAGNGLTLVDTTAGTGNFIVADVAGSGAGTDLGIVGNVAGNTINGAQVLASLNSTLSRNLLGGTGLSDGTIAITARDGTAFNLTLPTGGSVSDLIAAIRTGTGGKVIAALDQTGTGLTLTDTTGGASNLIVTGAAATAMGLATPEAGVASSTVSGARLQHRYIAESTLLSSLNGGRGVGTGTFDITDATGQTRTVDIGADSHTVGDVISEINSRGLALHARINDHGDGIILEEPPPPAIPGGLKIKVTDRTGSVAAGLNLAGEAAGTGVLNTIDGAYERTVTVLATDTLDQIVTKVNNASAGVRAGVINDGTPGSPFRLTFSGAQSGSQGRFTIATAGADLGVTTLSDGRDARVFYGAADPARGILLTSTTNTLDSVVNGVRIDLHSASETPVTLTVSRDTNAIQGAAHAFASAFNALVGRIDTLSAYDQQTNRRGTLLGDATTQDLRQTLFGTLQGTAIGVSGPFQNLAQVGVTIARDGTVQIDDDRLRAAIEQNPQAVADVFAARVQNPRVPVELAPGITVAPTGPDTFSSLGVAEQVAQLATRYTDTVTGVLTHRRQTLDSQIQLQNDRIAAFNQQLDDKRAILERQFQQMEAAIAQLQSQQSTLAGIPGFH